jgi:hypothetical protein
VASSANFDDGFTICKEPKFNPFPLKNESVIATLPLRYHAGV